MAKQNLGGVYANMDFPPYEFREFPKHIITGRGTYETANDKHEEEEIRERVQKEYDEAPIEALIHTPDPEREALISRARELNVPINRMWSITKLKATIEKAEQAMDDLPAEGEEQDGEITSEEQAEENKEELIAKAKSLGINKANHLWGIPRLKLEIADAEKNKQ